MRKTIAIAAIVALTAVSAMAYPGFRGQGGPCVGAGGQGGFGPGMGMGGGRFGGPGMKFQQDAKPVDDAGAKKLVQDYIDTNLKGFKIADILKVEVPRGAMYSFEVKDTNGNLFVFKVTPFGFLRGPIPAKEIK